MTMFIIINVLGAGKTTFLAWMALVEYLKGRKVYSNFKLNFPFTPIRSIQDLDSIRDGFLAIDDAYMWFYAPKGYNPWIDKILACSRKRKVDIAYTMTRSNQVHINIRVNTAFIFVPMLIPKVDLMIVPQFKYLSDRGMKGGDEERIGDLVQQFFVTDLPFIWSMFDTEEEIGALAGAEYGKK